jgi:type I restriction-modification system DNA methylase subunit
MAVGAAPKAAKSLETWIWDAACSIRGAKDAPKYKEYILPLIFAKRLCDVYDDEINRLAADLGGSRAKAFKLVRHDKELVRFYLPLVPENPDEPVWSIIRKLTDQIGQKLTDHLRAIADENPELKGIIDRIDFNATTPRRARPGRRSPQQPDRAHQREAARPERRRAGHHRPLLRVPDPQVRRGERLQRR